ncbi:DUF2268 domain-containing putative Zn-dependent protease (plasmid) [Kocuria rhizophila]|nr:DUF2268 domain-containing putative Zn-dependent protease [Kocuria rhizophila]
MANMLVAEGLADLFAVDLVGQQGFTLLSARRPAPATPCCCVSEGLDVTGMQDFAAWALGDASARLFGATPVGVPTGAGYAAGGRIARAYPDATGRPPAATVATPATEILAVALPQLGLGNASSLTGGPWLVEWTVQGTR